MSSIIGKYFDPDDNSFCIDLSTGKSSLIVQPSGYESNYMIGNELNAKFIIESDPYEATVQSFIGPVSCVFINVRSTKTNSTYRVLYNKRRVIDLIDYEEIT